MGSTHSKKGGKFNDDELLAIIAFFNGLKQSLMSIPIPPANIPATSQDTINYINNNTNITGKITFHNTYAYTDGPWPAWVAPAQQNSIFEQIINQLLWKIDIFTHMDYILQYSDISNEELKNIIDSRIVGNINLMFWVQSLRNPNIIRSS